MRHNEVRDITAPMLTEVCHGVATEPHLQLLTGETMTHRSANTEAGARLDVASTCACVYNFCRPLPAWLYVIEPKHVIYSFRSVE